MIRQVHFHGPLADAFGSEPIPIRAQNFEMLLRGLRSRFPDLKKKLLEFEQLAIIKQNGDDYKGVSMDGLDWNFGNYPDIHLSVSRQGSGFEFLGYVGWAAVAAMVAVNIAVTLVMSVVTKAMADTPKTNEGQATTKTESNLFNGAVNNLQQGHPVPLVYGTFKVGSTTISSEVSVEKQGIAAPDYVNATSGETVTGNVLSNDNQIDPLSVSKFTVDGVEHNAGATYTSTNYNVTINADGSYSVTVGSGYVGSFRIWYTAVGTTTTGAQSHLQVQVRALQVWQPQDPGGTGGVKVDVSVSFLHKYLSNKRQVFNEPKRPLPY